MKSFLAALSFLTILPVKTGPADRRELAASMIFFPVIGLILGLAAAGAYAAMSAFGFNALLSSVIIVILLIKVTGGLHMDGLADTSDALLSGRSGEEMLRIMRDSHIGAMGALSLIAVFSLKASLIFSINASSKAAGLILAPVLARWSMVLSASIFPYARSDGKANAFIAGKSPATLIIATAIAMAVTFMCWKSNGLLLLALIAAITYLFGKYAAGRLGGITGDILGATNELAEAAALFVFYLGT